MALNFIDVGSPIIQAYMHGRQLRQEQEQQLFERGMQEQQQKLREAESSRQEQQLQGYLKHLTAEEEHQHAQIALERAQHELEATRTMGQMQAAGQLRPIQAGEQVPQALQFQQGGQNLRLATPEEIRQFQLEGQRQSGQIQAQTAGAETTAKATAEEPFQVRATERQTQQKLQEMAAEHANKLGEIGEEAKGRMATTQLQAHAGITEAGIRARAETDAARIHMFGDPNMTADDWASRVTPYLYGEVKKPLGNAPIDQIMRNHIQAAIPGGQGQEITADKAQKVANLNRVFEIYDNMAGQIKNLPTSRVLANGQHQLAKISGTDSQNMQNQIESQAIPLLQAQGMYSAQGIRTEMTRLKGIMGGLPGTTQEQAISNINLGKSLATGNVLDTVLGGVNEKQKLMLLQHYLPNTDLSQFKTSYGGQQVPRYQKSPQSGQWLHLNPDKGTYDSIDAQ